MSIRALIFIRLWSGRVADRVSNNCLFPSSFFISQIPYSSGAFKSLSGIIRGLVRACSGPFLYWGLSPVPFWMPWVHSHPVCGPFRVSWDPSGVFLGALGALAPGVWAVQGLLGPVCDFLRVRFLKLVHCGYPLPFLDPPWVGGSQSHLVPKLNPLGSYTLGAWKYSRVGSTT